MHLPVVQRYAQALSAKVSTGKKCKVMHGHSVQRYALAKSAKICTGTQCKGMHWRKVQRYARALSAEVCTGKKFHRLLPVSCSQKKWPSVWRLNKVTELSPLLHPFWWLSWD